MTKHTVMARPPKRYWSFRRVGMGLTLARRKGEKQTANSKPALRKEKGPNCVRDWDPYELPGQDELPRPALFRTSDNQ